ncbi:hypothetical protein [Stappia sp. 28M-7]|uniref:hypothetical protein n=1 Tax=Stappia sp. 28M-7 TaxID=2762596 RepID=UPI00163C6560|nr:hypothetical protein [Stappia sp. 28M-7]MBC2858725.1 hypothetical protein [Stappia sp. 28M-7]
MLPRLQAEERLVGIDTVALGSGQVKSADARSAMRDLERAANGGRRRRAVKASPQQLAAMGIAVIEVPATEGGNE